MNHLVIKLDIKQPLGCEEHTRDITLYIINSYILSPMQNAFCIQ